MSQSASDIGATTQIIPVNGFIHTISKVGLGSNVHTKPRRPAAPSLVNSPYPAATAPAGASNLHGELERLPSASQKGNPVDVTHAFVEAGGRTWHMVTAGDPERETLLFVHGFPECWYTWHYQLSYFAEDYHLVAIDTPGSGQSDKQPDADYSYAGMATALAALIKRLEIERFTLVTHDRGTVLGDHLLATQVQPQVTRYIRTQQSASEPHSEPRPPHKLMGSAVAPWFFSRAFFPRIVFEQSVLLAKRLEPRDVERLDYEFKHPGVAKTVPLIFRETSFDQELAERKQTLFGKMTMPTLFLQGALDPGQQPLEYERVPELVPSAQLEFVEAGHFLQLETPELVNAAMHRFLQDS